jgi:hypothetical protein
MRLFYKLFAKAKELDDYWPGELYLALRDDQGHAPYTEIMLPRLPQVQEALHRLSPYKSFDFSPAAAKEEELWQWYALSRVNEYLLMSFQQSDEFYQAPSQQSSSWREWMKGVGYAHFIHWNGALITAEQYEEFFAALGFHLYTKRPYHPFYHEIVEAVETTGIAEDVVVDQVFWPGLMFGEMLFSRAGVRVLFRPGLLDKTMAENSRLYFAHWRLRREVADLSHGWGSNSQWRTSFRRDYETAEKFYFNVDGTRTLGKDAPSSGFDEDGSELDDLTLEERIELLTNRCFVRCPKEGKDRWPFDDKYELLKAPLLL